MTSVSPSTAPCRGRILVVDDDRLVLTTVAHGLRHAGFEVWDADNGDDAILLARQHRPELALLDVRMDGMSGFDVARYLRDALQIPFLFLTAFSDEATLTQVRALGALQLLVKPLELTQIVPALDAAMQQVRQEASVTVAAPSPVSLPRATPPCTDSAGAGSTAHVLEPVLAHVEALAVGIVMHRFSLPRQAAWERLQRSAAQEGRSLHQTCQAVVQAVEQLALPGV